MNETTTSTSIGQDSTAGQSNLGAQQAQTLFGGNEGAQSTAQSGGSSSVPEQDQKQAASGALTAEHIREIVSSTAREVGSAMRPAPEQKELSQDEINKMLQVFNVSPEHATRFAKALGLADVSPEQAAQLGSILNELLEGKMRQAVTMSAVQLEALRRNDLGALQQRLSPVMNFVQQQRENELRNTFYSTFEDAKGYEPVMELIYKEMVDEMKAGRLAQFKTDKEALSAAHERFLAVKAKLPGLQGGQQPQTRSTTGSRSTPQGRQMSTVSTGGQSAGGAGGAQMSDGEKLARRLFGNS